jgi:preprotein translocase subunit SecG
MFAFLLVIHCTVCVLMILVVLLQAGRGAGLAVFGGGGDAVFASPSGSSFLKKFTATLAGTFAVTALLLTLLWGRASNRSVTQGNFRLPVSGQTKTDAAASAEASKAAAAAEPAGTQAGGERKKK